MSPSRGFEWHHRKKFKLCYARITRPNLLKRFAASTLEIFQSEYTFKKRARRMGDHGGGEGACAGPVFGSLRLPFSFSC